MVFMDELANKEEIDESVLYVWVVGISEIKQILALSLLTRNRRRHVHFHLIVI